MCRFAVFYQNKMCFLIPTPSLFSWSPTEITIDIQLSNRSIIFSVTYQNYYTTIKAFIDQALKLYTIHLHDAGYLKETNEKRRKKEDYSYEQLCSDFILRKSSGHLVSNLIKHIMFKIFVLNFRPFWMSCVTNMM